MASHSVPFCKFLGVIIDEHLTWINHINYVKSKISINTGFLSRICNFVSIKTALMLYYSLIYPYLIYCNIAWASNYPSRLKTLYISQKRSIRIIFHLPPGSSTHSKFVENNILNIYQLNMLQIGLFMFKLENNLLPCLFENFLFILFIHVLADQLAEKHFLRTVLLSTVIKNNNNYK